MEIFNHRELKRCLETMESEGNSSMDCSSDDTPAKQRKTRVETTHSCKICFEEVSCARGDIFSMFCSSYISEETHLKRKRAPLKCECCGQFYHLGCFRTLISYNKGKIECLTCHFSTDTLPKY